MNGVSKRVKIRNKNEWMDKINQKTIIKSKPITKMEDDK